MLTLQSPTTTPANAKPMTGTVLEAVAAVAALPSKSTMGAVALVVVLEVDAASVLEVVAAVVALAVPVALLPNVVVLMVVVV
eukprot:CAMPEP_0195135202 /NCGR_PEP_ID=MMETSP0448-20130528/152031_1 /TAXON_ID=66468 /ORGANISM="Heterocapsa triquestra, Strain CCMP 448" /LENGTH=81 /DNA_ID=CAMNT_0040173325 /DNA_START=36 /DNA_END=278 /DNA_ORIENTATION=+